MIKHHVWDTDLGAQHHLKRHLSICSRCASRILELPWYTQNETHLFKDGMCCIMEKPDGGDTLCGSQVLQIHQKRDRIKMEEVLSQRPQSPQVLHQLHPQTTFCKTLSLRRAVSFKVTVEHGTRLCLQLTGLFGTHGIGDGGHSKA